MFCNVRCGVPVSLHTDVTVMSFVSFTIRNNVILASRKSRHDRNTHPVVRCGAFRLFDAIIFGVVLLDYLMLLFLVKTWWNNISKRFTAKMAAEIGDIS